MAGWKVFLVSCFMRVGIVSVLGDCGDLPRSEKAVVVDDNLNVFPVNTTLTYSCRPGYIWDRSSNKKVICQENSKWTELTITCTPKSCGPLPDVPHGSIKYSDGIVFGSVARISCETGYNIVGRNQRVCMVDGWDHQNPECEPVICDAPPEVVDGTVELGFSSRDIPVGTVATYRCKKFQLIGSTTIYCTLSGSWSSSPPICKDVKCPDPQIVNGYKISNFGPTYRYLDSTTFECKSGYWMNGSSTITCKEDNNWDPKPPICETKSCGPLPDVPHGSIKYSDGVAIGSVARISCDEGYNIVGKNQRVCLIDGWDHQNPVCEPVVCNAPPEIVDGTIELGSSSQAILVGTVATYICKKFQLIGNATIYCTKSGSWSNSPPICKDVNCPDPQVANGRKTSNFGPNYHYLNFTEFECISGWMNGSSRITCKEDNNWDPSPPTCEHTDTSKNEILSVVGGVCGGGVCLVAGTFAGHQYYKKKNGGSNKTTEEKMCPASSVNTSSQQYSALQSKDTNV